MRMMPKALHTWSQRLRLRAKTEALIASIQASFPVRGPSGRGGWCYVRYRAGVTEHRDSRQGKERIRSALSRERQYGEEEPSRPGQHADLSAR